MLLSHCRTLLTLALLISVISIPPVRAQPTLVKDINLRGQSSNPDNLVAIGNVVYFATEAVTDSDLLWRSDGTAAGTFVVSEGYNSCFAHFLRHF
jgi:ELWxxDGT repeat protein